MELSMIKELIFNAALLAITPSLWAQPKSTFTGTWRADKYGSPYVIVRLTHDQNSHLGGSAVFYVLDRADSNVPPKVLGNQEVQLLEPKLVDNVLFFKVRNQQGDVTMNPSSGESLIFKMILKDDNHATLKSPGDSAGLVLEKTE
jgi:hypothetical protein